MFMVFIAVLILIATIAILISLNELSKSTDRLADSIDNLEIRLPAGEVSEETVRELERIAKELKSLSQKQ